MSILRQPAVLSEPDGSIWVRSFAVRFTAGFRDGPHSHDWRQLSYASEGLLRVTTEDAAWFIPPQRAVLLPPRIVHSEEMPGAGALRSLYFADALAGELPDRCIVLRVNGLLRELILEASRIGVLDAAKPAQKRLAQVIVDQVALLEPLPHQALPMPRDRRGVAIARRLQAEPALDVPLATLARDAGAGARTAQRLFLAETGLSFVRWRQRLRLFAAAERLSAGRSVTDAALDVGYAGVSAFVSAFRREFGQTPGRFG
jgi:AraC-like DNA-binding protein